jgi:polysaccharide export outer membrane protein
MASLAACLPQGVNTVPLASIAPRGEPTLAPGDALRITVWRHPEFSGDFVVGRDSTLVNPVYQTIRVGGLSPNVARERIRTLLATYEQGVQMTVEPLWPVSVLGEVRLPNLYHLPSGTTVPQAVALAGGPTDRGQLASVQLYRPTRGIVNLDLLADMQRADSVRVWSGDQLVVARRKEFSFIHDFLVPVSSVTAAFASVYAVSKAYGH